MKRNININYSMTRIDLIFSYWIFLWYIFYIFKLIKYNPKFAILCGIFENFILLVLMFFYKTKSKLVLLFFIMVVLLKLIPLYTIWNTYIKYTDIVFTLFLFLIYLVWIKYNNKSISDFNQNTMNMILYNKNTLPGMMFLDKII